MPHTCYVFFRKWPISFYSSGILKNVHSLLSCSLVDLSLLAEVTCQLGRYKSGCFYTFFRNKLLAELVFFPIQVIGALPYLDRELSPAKYRSFFIPYLWQRKNIFGMYKLLRRVPKWNLGSDRITELDSELAWLVLTPPPAPPVSSEGKPPFLMI